MKPWESPALQTAESAKHLPAQHVVIPTCDGLAVYRCRGAERHLVEIFSQPDDLAGYFTSHFNAQEAARPPVACDPLANLGDIELDL